MVEASDLVIHHRVLQKFLQDAGTSLSQPNSTRVAKAREKLAKLSVSQFAELSTDVYDELQRRTNTSPQKPKTLLPKPTFHPKRNQAREKLASLQESRFGDLAKDIAYEVERRGFHESVEQPSYSENVYGNQRSMDKPYENLDILKHSPQRTGVEQTRQVPTNVFPSTTYADESFMNDSTLEISTPVADAFQKEIRSKLVVPSKASLSWSSDEDEDAVFPKAANEVKLNGSPVNERLSLRRSKETDLKLLMEESTKMDQKITALESEKYSLLSDIEDLEIKLKAKEEELVKQQKAWSLEKQGLDQQLKELQQNLEFKHEELENTKQITSDWEGRHKAVNDDFARLQEMYEDLTDKHRQTSETHQELVQEKTLLMEQISKLQDVNMAHQSNASDSSHLIEELANLKQAHAKLQADNETMARTVLDHQNLNKQYDALKEEHSNLQRSVPTVDLTSELKSLRLSHSALQAENERLKKSSANSTASNPEDVVALKKQVIDWQQKYQSASGDFIAQSLNGSPLSDQYIKSMTASSGLLLASSVSNLMASSKVFLLGLEPETLDVDIFFDGVSQFATFAGVIASEGESDGSPSSTEQCRFVRAAIANFITASRYYAIYNKSIPKLVVQAAMNDVCFTVCDLIAAAKIRSGTDKASTILKTPISDRFPSEVPRSYSTKPEDDVSPVRPLKMAQRLGSATPSPEATLPRTRDSPTPRMSFLVKPGSKLKDDVMSTPNSKDVTSQASPSSTKSSSILSKVQQFESPEKLQNTKRYSPPKDSFPSSNAGFSKFGLKANNVSPNQSRVTSKDDQDYSPNGKAIPLNTSTIENRKPSDGSAQRSFQPSAVDNQRKVTAKENFDISRFDIRDPDNTLEELLHYLEHQTVEVIAAIQMLLASIKDPNITIGALRTNAEQILNVIHQMVEATSTSMNQTRNAMLKEHGSWIVQSLVDCAGRMKSLCASSSKDQEFADKNFKQRLAGVTFDIVRSTNELAKTVEEASLKEEIAILDARLQHGVVVN
ncbi:unnamed protein product [Kuraishia capsulata CBS 1993]|uniref:GIT Spa2 homology (SHD) domain-containing protein n=1 Tax=Kuraishia capsulata CBS 1993 TaxID=1382522 RepID=W6MKQ5_9ASCO|nr:uncharacterized protein KUCA_T00003031001 [Kuraishia capsulata CBS 1993]CDK27054.1 unnamed protein product [Kuraishia capsulata CBS 1993]